MANLNGDATYTQSAAGFGEQITDSVVYVSNGLLTESTFTVEAFITPLTSTSASNRVALSQRDLFYIFLDSSGILQANYGAQGNAIELVSNYSFLAGERVHVALQVGPLGSKLYANGILAASSATSGEDATPVFGIENFVVGAFSSGFNFVGSIDEVAVWNYERYPSDFTPPTAPYDGNESGLLHLYHLDSSLADSSSFSPPQQLPQDVVDGEVDAQNDKLIYSPGNWFIDSTGAKTIAAGAYVRALIVSDSCVLNFDISQLASPLPRINVIVDGVFQQEQEIAATINVSIPNTNMPKHIVEVVIDAIGAGNRWGTSEGKCVFNGITLDQSGDLQYCERRKYNTWIFGDSTTEGYRARGSVGTRTEQDSSLGAWAHDFGRKINSEISCMGYSGTGISKNSNGVPRLADAYGYVYGGQEKDFSSSPDFCLWLEGINDGVSDTTNDGLLALNGMLSDMPNTKFLILRPLTDDNQTDNLQFIVNNCDDPSRVFYDTTEGFFNRSESTDTVHPYSYEHLTSISQGITNLTYKHLIRDEYEGETSSATIVIDGIPDGTYRTVIASDDSRLVFDANLTYSSGSAVADSVKASVGSNLLGAIVDNSNPHISGAVVSVNAV